VGHVDLAGVIDIYDRDVVKLHNTNRSPLFSVEDAEIPGKRPGRPKVEVLADFLRPTGLQVVPHSAWYDEAFDRRPTGYDLWLPLANERGVRRTMQHNFPPLMLHATTSRNWSINLYRHRPDVDDCLPCRIRDDSESVPELGCSPGTMQESPGRPADAALPFQSAAAGTLLGASVTLLATTGDAVPDNYFEYNFRSSGLNPIQLQRRCRRGCLSPRSETITRRYNADTRYLDAAR
jgi:hypothetical protein